MDNTSDKNVSSSSNVAPFFMAGWRHLAAWILIAIIIKYFILDDYLMQLGLIDKATSIDSYLGGILLTALIALAGIRQFDKFHRTDTRRFDDYPNRYGGYRSGASRDYEVGD